MGKKIVYLEPDRNENSLSKYHNNEQIPFPNF